MTKLFYVLVQSVFLVGVAYADMVVNSNGVTKNINSVKGFSAQMELTDDMNFFDRWNTTKTPGINLKTLSHVQRNKPFQPVIFFINPGIDALGKGNISADIIVRAPDGSVYGQGKNINCWENLPAPPFPNFQLCKDTLAIVIEDKDKAGRYSVESEVHDLIKKVDITTQQYFDVQ